MIVDLLKQYTGMTEAEIKLHFTVTETEKETTISSEWLETSTFAGMKKLITEQGGWYEVVKSEGKERPVFHIPKPKQAPIREGSEGVTPECINIDNNKGNGDYSLARSMKGKLGQLVPCLADAEGVVFDGLHRKKINPSAWTVKLDQVKTAADKVMARLIANNCRRKYMDEEFHNDIGFLKGAGVSAEQIHEITGIGMTTIYKYMPQELKKPEKVEAGKASGVARSVPPAEQTVKTQDTGTPVHYTNEPELLRVEGTHARINHTRLTECESCHLGTEHPQPFGKFNNLCEKCFDRACRNPAEFKRPALEVKMKEPAKPKESWEHRAAVMKPQHSKMEERLLAKLSSAGYSPETDREFCLQSTTPDFYFPKQNLAVFVDGPVHQGREDRDEALRELLTRRHNIRVLTVQYEKDSDEDGCFGEIKGMLEEKP